MLCPVPGQPSKFQVGTVSDTSIELTWEPAYEKEGIINYELRYKEGNYGTQVSVDLFIYYTKALTVYFLAVVFLVHHF